MCEVYSSNMSEVYSSTSEKVKFCTQWAKKVVEMLCVHVWYV